MRETVADEGLDEQILIELKQVSHHTTHSLLVRV